MYMKIEIDRSIKADLRLAKMKEFQEWWKGLIKELEEDIEVKESNHN